MARALARVPPWDAINDVVVASGGNAGNTSVARQRAVVAVERAVDALLAQSAPETTDDSRASGEKLKHSPGPWQACGNGLCVCGQVWSPGNDMPVATAFRQDDEVGELPEETWKANVRLIEAAPAMADRIATLEAQLAEALAANKAMRTELRVTQQDGNNEADELRDQLATMREERDAARATIAELSALFPQTIAPPDDDCAEDWDPTCGKCGATVSVDDGCEFDPGDPCHHCAQESYSKAGAILGQSAAQPAAAPSDLEQLQAVCEAMREQVEVASRDRRRAVELLKACNFSQSWAEDREAFLADLTARGVR
jgi:hypothetical protein